MIACGICSMIGFVDPRVRSRVDGAGLDFVDSPRELAESLMDTEAFGLPAWTRGVGSTSISSSSAVAMTSDEVLNPISSRNRFSASSSGAK